MYKLVNGFFKWTGVFLTGVISGVAIGLLSAPKSGRELRNDLAYKSRKWQRDAKEKIDETLEQGKHQVENVASSIKSTADKISSKAHSLLNGKTKEETIGRI